MEITDAQYRHIAPWLPTQRGNVTLDNLQVLNAILYVAEQGCKWRGLPKRFGNWHTIYTRMNRWSKSGVLGGSFHWLGPVVGAVVFTALPTTVQAFVPQIEDVAKGVVLLLIMVFLPRGLIDPRAMRLRKANQKTTPQPVAGKDAVV